MKQFTMRDEEFICENCNKVLGYNYDNTWNLKVELY